MKTQQSLYHTECFHCLKIQGHLDIPLLMQWSVLITYQGKAILACGHAWDWEGGIALPMVVVGYSLEASQEITRSVGICPR